MRTLPRLVVAFLVCATLSAQAPQTLQRTALAEAEAYAAEEFAKDPVGSLTVGIVTNGVLVWTRSYGYADMEAKRPASDETYYRVGSITKQFTGLMLLQAAERGSVRLTDPVEKYVPEMSAIKNPHAGTPPITLLQLATMTSGLAREPSGPFDHSLGPVSAWEQIVLGVMPRVTYAHEPGTKYLYCNIGYAILGLALGRATGQPYTTYVGQQILAPLGMSNTVFEPTPAMKANLARGYDIDREGKISWAASEREWAGRGYRVPNGALISTMRDLAKFVAWELGSGPDSVLKRETQRDNYSRVLIAAGDMRSGYGIGFQVARRGAIVAQGHGGTTSGFLSQALFDRESRTGVIVLRNVTGGKLDPNAVAMRMLEIVSTTGRGAMK
jgi:CubicO group peptidase (beta-lactamase class C family)